VNANTTDFCLVFQVILLNCNFPFFSPATFQQAVLLHSTDCQGQRNLRIRSETIVQGRCWTSWAGGHV